MINFLDKLLDIYRKKGQIALLSYTYGAIALVSVIFAGFCALINQSFGVAVLIIPLVSITALCMNVVVWSLVRFSIQSYEEKKKQIEADRKTADRIAKKSKK
jgi:hypothetical protein